ncbi:MAG: long-chain acyl-CoA synthetase [Sphingobacteriales bacterium]|jgi:long-chain acyl-CoA synthetase
MQIKRLFDILPRLKEQFPKNDILNTKVNGKWINYSVNDLEKIVNELSLGMISLGLVKGDSVANMSPNRPEWNFVDFAMLQIGLKHVPLYPTLSEKDLIFILNDAEVKIAFAADKDLYDKIVSIKDKVPSLNEIYSFDLVEGARNYKEVAKLGENGDLKALEAIKSMIEPDDLATLIYTSGTTGVPKGVMLTHNNVVSNVLATSTLVPSLSSEDKALSFLPMCHIFERMVVYMYLNRGISVYYAESLETIADNLKEIKPQMFTTVPRLLEKVYDKIVGKGMELSGVKKKLFFWALDLGLRYDLYGANGAWYEFQLKIANKLIFSKWREALGNNIKAIVSGGAALQPRLSRVFNAGNITVLQGYGLTETSPVISVGQTGPNGNYLGSSGPVIDGVEVKIASDGEILAKGPNVMIGYYKNPEATAEVIDKDGWFHTGDIGEFVNGRFLTITDRKKEMFKTAGGKYVTPQVLENKYKESTFIEQIMVIGENRKFPGALIVPTFATVKDWCKHKGIAYTTDAEMAQNPQVIDKFKREIEALNVDFGHWEQVKRFQLLTKEFSIEAGEMTPKLSLKRKNIFANYADLVDKIYGSSEEIVH